MADDPSPGTSSTKKLSREEQLAEWREGKKRKELKQKTTPRPLTTPRTHPLRPPLSSQSSQHHHHGRKKDEPLPSLLSSSSPSYRRRTTSPYVSPYGQENRKPSLAASAGSKKNHYHGHRQAVAATLNASSGLSKTSMSRLRGQLHQVPDSSSSAPLSLGIQPFRGAPGEVAQSSPSMMMNLLSPATLWASFHVQAQDQDDDEEEDELSSLATTTPLPHALVIVPDPSVQRPSSPLTCCSQEEEEGGLSYSYSTCLSHEQEEQDNSTIRDDDEDVSRASSGFTGIQYGNYGPPRHSFSSENNNRLSSATAFFSACESAKEEQKKASSLEEEKEAVKLNDKGQDFTGTGDYAIKVHHPSSSERRNSHAAASSTESHVVARSPVEYQDYSSEVHSEALLHDNEAVTFTRGTDHRSRDDDDSDWRTSCSPDYQPHRRLPRRTDASELQPEPSLRFNRDASVSPAAESEEATSHASSNKLEDDEFAADDDEATEIRTAALSPVEHQDYTSEMQQLPVDVRVATFPRALDEEHGRTEHRLRFSLGSAAEDGEAVPKGAIVRNLLQGGGRGSLSPSNLSSVATASPLEQERPPDTRMASPEEYEKVEEETVAQLHTASLQENNGVTFTRGTDYQSRDDDDSDSDWRNCNSPDDQPCRRLPRRTDASELRPEPSLCFNMNADDSPAAESEEATSHESSIHLEDPDEKSANGRASQLRLETDSGVSPNASVLEECSLQEESVAFYQTTLGDDMEGLDDEDDWRNSSPGENPSCIHRNKRRLSLLPSGPPSREELDGCVPEILGDDTPRFDYHDAFEMPSGASPIAEGKEITPQHEESHINLDADELYWRNALLSPSETPKACNVSTLKFQTIADPETNESLQTTSESREDVEGKCDALEETGWNSLPEQDALSESNGCIGPHELVKLNGRTVLPTVPENVVVSSQEQAMKVLHNQMNQILVEKRTLEDRLSAAIFMPHDERVTPFRDVFNELRKTRKEFVILQKKKQECDNSIEYLQEKFKEVVTLATEKTDKMESKLHETAKQLSVTQEKLAEAQSRVHELESKLASLESQGKTEGTLLR